MAQLFFSQGRAPHFCVRLHSHSTKIGRSDHCDVVLNDSEVSREHAAIFSVDGQYLLKKLGQGRLLVNGKEIASHPLKDGDKIAMGSWEASFQLSALSSATLEDTSHHQTRAAHTQAVALRSGSLLVKAFALRIHEPSKPPRIFPLSSEVITVGAGKKNDLVIEDPYVSSQHFKLLFRDGKIFLYDLGSTNGTWVNGVKVREAELEVGYSIRVGSCQLTVIAEEKLEATEALHTDHFCGLIGASPLMRELYGLLQRMGPTEATILILGESGTGKELVAQAIHHLSPRAKKPFLAINCGAISPELIESELFGHEKGAFTGAERRHEGAFSQAAGGTLFLDEVGELPLELQPKLLRVLENKTYRRVGGSEELHTDVRIIAATHRDLTTAIQEKKFREDLFFRLFVLPVYLAPLRERKEDIPLLSEFFLKEFTTGTSSKTLSREAIARLQEYPFGGNVRELRNVLLRSVILSKGAKIEVHDLLFPHDFQMASGRVEMAHPPLIKLEEMERRLVLKALTACNWNKAKASEALGVAKSTLFSKIKLYGLQEPDENVVSTC